MLKRENGPLSRPWMAVVMLLSAGWMGCGGGPATEPGDTSEGADAPTAAAGAVDAPPERIVAERGGFIPEGVEYDMTNRRFLTGSLSEGTVFEIGSDGGVTPFISDDELISSVGIEVDELRDRLFVANADFGFFQGTSSGQAKLGVYDLDTGERLAMVDLAAVADAGEDAEHFANDVAVADDGTAFVTDTPLNAIYRVEPDYTASLLVRFGDGPPPNGLVHHFSGYLLVGRGDTLWKVPVDDPGAAAEVDVSEPVPGQDGLVWSVGRLAIVSNSSNQVSALTSDDDWVSANVVAVATYDEPATTGAVVDDDVYVVHPVFQGEGMPSLERVVFQ